MRLCVCTRSKRMRARRLRICVWTVIISREHEVMGQIRMMCNDVTCINNYNK